jgi:hypothetical protein
MQTIKTAYVMELAMPSVDGQYWLKHKGKTFAYS